MHQRNIVIIGGDAAGMSAASKIRRTDPHAKVTVLEKGVWVSYSACGLPFFLQGVVPEIGDLVARTAEEHRANGIDVRTGHEAAGIDVRKRVVAAATEEGERLFPYDKLLIATGARARRPAFAQTDMAGVSVLRGIPDAPFYGHAEIWFNRYEFAQAAGPEIDAGFALAVDDCKLFIDLPNSVFFVAKEHVLVDRPVVTEPIPGPPEV